MLILLLLLLAIGVVGGFLSGLLGIGGGLIFVPVLFFCITWLGYDGAHAMHVAVGTSMAVVLATISASAYHHFRRDAVDGATLRDWGPWLVLGSMLGLTLASATDGQTLKEIFAGLMIVMAFYMALSKEPSESAPARKVPGYAQHAFCVAVGAVSSMVGVGGAILNIPMMVYSRGIPIRRAVGTGAALGITIALPGMIGYMISGYPHLQELPPLSLGYVSLPAVATIIPASVLMSPVGVRAAHGLPKYLLRRIFAIVLILVSIRMLTTL